MMFRKLTTLAAASALVIVSAAAAQASQPIGAPADMRAGAGLGDASQLRDTPTHQLAFLIAIALVIWGLSELLESDPPDSP